MRVLIAPDCFGDSLTAVEAARSIAAGWRAARPADVLVPAPQSDGGPGFLEVLAARERGFQARRSRVAGPLAGQVEAGWLFDGDTRTAYLECAQACGLHLLGGPPTPQTALAAHSRGLGELIGAALTQGARTVVIGLGGSGCTDGGRGMVEALGGPDRAVARLAGVRLIAATDVENPLLGPRGAAQVFGPQKGADPDTVAVLEDRISGWAADLEAVAGRPIRGEPGAGAAGGIGAALLALGGRRESGASVIAEHTGLAAEIGASDLVVTGEGRLDDQSLHGKVVGALARMAAAAGPVPVLVLAGQVTLDAAALREAGIAAAHSLADYCGSVRRAIDDAAEQLTGLAERVAAGLPRE
ncbi:MAG TPA: glycerate kinase [Mycobacterium sp.]|nr:glycerate kinase [Mycolicibacterium sp.]HPX36242.1 glycerate kinase [Mycobacterium sp.]HQC75356.1 glycerate kinase [Mycobacterium sp.]